MIDLMSDRTLDLDKLRSEFNEFDPLTRAAILTAVWVDLGGKIAAWISLSRRRADQVRGPKWVWALAQFINGIGPVSYWLFGRK